ncbi:MAG: DUF4292 domain-containing protein [Marinifilaceae bacterium]|jgi:hypothetical protein|nr:DUF4292 domain-containing protein [Marinifilaceae bacterium]
MLKTPLRLILISLISTIAFSSCKTVYQSGSVKAKQMSDNKLYRNIQDSSLKFSNLNFKKLNINYQTDSIRKKFKASIRIKKDSIIWISIIANVGGIEAARLYITPDSVKMINKIEKEYYLYGIEYIKKQLNMDVDFYSLQNILTNQLFDIIRQEKHKTFTKKFNGKIVDNKYKFVSVKARKVNRKLRKEKLNKLQKYGYQTFTIEPSNMRISEVTVRELESNRSVRLEYSEFKDYDTFKFPKLLNVIVNADNTNITTKIKFGKIAIDSPKLKYSFRIPSKYKLVQLEKK